MALRDILRCHTTSVANGDIAEIDTAPSIWRDDARDPVRIENSRAPSSQRLGVVVLATQPTFGYIPYVFF
jgi:hypothetical protein